MRLISIPILVSMALAPAVMARADDKPYRTPDGDPKKPWYEPRPGVFPPADAALADAGRLVRVDGYNRAGRYLCDDVHGIDYLDHYTDFEFLPYGVIRRHGARAELSEIPIGTHLHFQLFPSGPVPGIYSFSKTTRGKILSAEDDFSYRSRRGESYRIEELALGRERLLVTLRKNGDPVGDAKKRIELSVGDDTRVWKGRGIGTLADLAVGQDILINTTGSIPFQDSALQAHCTEIWVDGESRTLATELQAARHRAWIRQRGLPAWVDLCEGKRVTLTFFDELDSFPGTEGRDGAPRREFRPDRPIELRPATEGLRTWLPIHGTTMPAKVREVREAPDAVGSGRLTIVIEPKFLLEGFRPGKIVRVFPSGWPAYPRPVEEEYHPMMSP